MISIAHFLWGWDVKNFNEIVESAPNVRIEVTLLKVKKVLSEHRRIAISVSGGSDSDIIIDIIELIRPMLNCDVRYAFFDTGLEYLAAHRHLNYLEQRYNVTIERLKPRKTIPVACREYGVPFISKDVSEMMNRLQIHGFDWRDSPENATPEKYGRCKSALDWYYSRRPLTINGKSKHNISRYKLLREFIMANEPDFAVSERCCDYAKKHPANDFHKEYRPDLIINGMRQAEGGRRAGSIKTCFTLGSEEKRPDAYRPIWYWSDEDKAAYKMWRGIRYSDCYEVYGLRRTGCVGCPCNSKAEQELTLVEPFEPQIVKAARSVFGASYDYKRRYVEFKQRQK